MSGYRKKSLPVPNSKCVSVLGQYNCNSSSLLNHRLNHVTFLTYQTCVHSDFTMITLLSRAKTKLHAGIAPTIYLSLDVSSSSCATVTVAVLAFAPSIYAWKKQISSEKASQIFYMGYLHLQLPSTDSHLKFGTCAQIKLFCPKTLWNWG